MTWAVAAVLILGSAVSMPLFKVAGITLSGDRIVGLAAVAVVLVFAVHPGLRWTRIHGALGLFVATQLGTSLLNARAWPRGMLLVTVYVLGFACFALTAQVTQRADVRGFATRVLVATGAVVGFLAGGLAAVANLSGRPVWGTAFVPMGHKGGPFVFGAYATFLEPNFLGSFLLIPLALQLWAMRAERRAPFLLSRGGLLLAGIVTGIVFSCTRAAWIGLLGIAVAWTWSRRPPWTTAAQLFGTIALVFALQIATTGPAAFLQRTVLPFLTGTDSTVTPRASISAAMLHSWLERPLVGHGAGAGNRLTVTQPDGHILHGLWAGNVEVHLLQNSGLLGLAAFLVLAAVMWLEVQRTRRRGGADDTLGGLAACGVWLLFAFQFTHGLWVMFPYVYLGLLTAAVYGCAERERADRSPSPRPHPVAQGTVHHAHQ
jgi:hypothetical protein